MQFIIYFVAGVLVILWVATFYFVKKGKLSAKTWFDLSLGLPKGSVRALIAFIILFLLLCPVLTGQSLPDFPDWLVGILGTVIGFYFGVSATRRTENEGKGNNKGGENKDGDNQGQG